MNKRSPWQWGGLGTHRLWVRLSCSLFSFWLFSPWLGKLYNIFPFSFSVAGRGGKTWRGPRQTVNGLDFQWSSQSADRCLTWERDWRSCQLGPGAKLLLWGNLHRWWWIRRHCMQTLGSFCPPRYAFSLQLTLNSVHLMVHFRLCFLNGSFLCLCSGFLLVLFSPLFLLLARRIQEAGGMAEATCLILNLMLLRVQLDLSSPLF